MAFFASGHTSREAALRGAQAHAHESAGLGGLDEERPAGAFGVGGAFGGGEGERPGEDG